MEIINRNNFYWLLFVLFVILYALLKTELQWNLDTIGRVLIFAYFSRYVSQFLCGRDMFIPRLSRAYKESWEDLRPRVFLFALGLAASLFLAFE